jgi:outer membrane lipoprotein carrier protein
MKDVFPTTRVPAIILLILLTVCRIAAEDTPLSPADSAALLGELEKKLSKITTLRASFDQTKHLALFDDALSAKGAIYFQNPGKIRFEIRTPFKSILVVASKKVAKYEDSKGTWKRLALKNADALALVMQQIGDWMRGDFRSQSRIFEVSALTRNGKSFLILTSKPKRFAKIISRIEIELANDRSRFDSITIREPGGDYTILRFTGDIRDKAFPAGAFDVDKSEPVEIRDAGQ